MRECPPNPENEPEISKPAVEADPEAELPYGDDMTDGGETGWTAVDATGTRYRVEQASHAEGSTNTITSLPVVDGP